MVQSCGTGCIPGEFLFHEICFIHQTFSFFLTPTRSMLFPSVSHSLSAQLEVPRLTSYQVRFIPEWLIPGGGFQKDARETKEKAFAALNMPFETVVAEMVSCFVMLAILIYHMLVGARDCPPFLCLEHVVPVGSRL